MEAWIKHYRSLRAVRVMLGTVNPKPVTVYIAPYVRGPTVGPANSAYRPEPIRIKQCEKK